MKNIITKVIIALVVVLLFIPIISEMVENSQLKEISYSEVEKTVSSTKEYNFALIYIGASDKDYKSTIRNLIKDNTPVDGREANVYYIDASKMKEADSLELIGQSGIKDAYVFAFNGDIVKVIREKLDNNTLEAYIKEFVSLGVDDSIKAYKIPETADEYIEAMNSDKVTMAVFGRDTCFYCNKFKIIYNTVAEEYNLDVYYFSSESNKDHINSKAYPSSEYAKLMELDITVPASCSKTKEDAKISEGFNTPFTVFTRNGKVLDTICGYVSKNDLITKMETVGMISAE